MSKKRPSYTTEFKQESASLVLDKDYTIPEACTAMGVGYTALRRWVKQLDAERGGVTPKAKAITSEQQTIQALEAKIKKIEWEKEILKKATALLMSDSIN
jgi:transposase